MCQITDVQYYDNSIGWKHLLNFHNELRCKKLFISSIYFVDEIFFWQ